MIFEMYVYQLRRSSNRWASAVKDKCTLTDPISTDRGVSVIRGVVLCFKLVAQSHRTFVKYTGRSG